MAISAERRAEIQRLLQQPAAPAPAQSAPQSSVPMTTPPSTGGMTPERRAQIQQMLQQTPQAAPGVQTPPQATPDAPGGFQGFVQGIAKPFLKLGSSVAGIAEGTVDLARGDVAGAKDALTRERDMGYFGTARPIGIDEQGQQMSTGAGIKDILGTGAELGSYVVGGGGALGVGRATLGGAVKQGVKTGVQSGVVGGALQGGGAEAQRQDSTAGSILGQGALGAGIGGATGGILGGALPVAGAGVRKIAGSLTPEGRVQNIVSKNRKALDTLETGNAPIRKAFAQAERGGITDIKDRLIQGDYLVGSVDDNGRIRTSKPGGALEKLDKEISPAESAVTANIEREAKMIDLGDLERYMMRNVQNANIEGAAKKTALNKLAAEIDGLRMDAVGNRIPLSTVQRLKIYKGKAVNFADPDIQQTDKAITRALKEFIEDNVDGIDVKKINSELSELYTLRDVLQTLDGKIIKGGRLGKYFSQTVGAIAGGQVGGPAGAVIGAEIGGRVQGGLLSRTLSKGTGNVPKLSDDMLEAIAKGKSPLPEPPLIPESRRLPAPNDANRPAIPMRGPTQIDPPASIIGGIGQKAGTYSTNLGSRKIIQSTTPTAMRNSSISKTIPQKSKSIVEELKGPSDRKQYPGLDADGRAKETAAYAMIDKNRQKIVDAHAKLPETFGGKLLNPDDFRPLVHDTKRFGPYKGVEAQTVHEPVSELANALKNEKIATLKKDDLALFTAGGPGNGKTSAIQGVSPEAFERMAFGYDSVLGNPKKAATDIRAVLAKGATSYIPYVWRKVDDAWVEGVLGRAKSKGRTLPLEVYLDGMENAWKSIQKLHDEFGENPGVVFRFINNESSGKNPALGTIDDVKKLDFTNLKKKYYDKLFKLTEDLYEKGDISKEIRDGLLGKAP